MASAADILDGIRDWVEIESQTADVDGVNRLMTLVAGQFSTVGAKVTRIPGTSGCGDHLRIACGWDNGEPGVLVLCHLDTVHPKGTLANHLPFRVEGNRAYGPGIYDMKGGAYLAFAAYRAIAANGKPTPLPVRFVYSSDEEIGSGTSRALIEAEAANAKYVLVTEPARDGGKVVSSRRGVARYVMSTRGRPAHSGARHQDGRSAILELARQVVDIEALTDYKRGLSFNVGLISGGTAANTVPEHCTASIDMRIRTMADAEALDAHLRALKPYNADVRLEISGGLNRPPFEKNAGIDRMLAHARTLAKEIGFELPDVHAGGGSDANFTAHLIPTLDGLGVDGNGAHTLEEHLYIPSLVPRMTLQKRLFETLN